MSPAPSRKLCRTLIIALALVIARPALADPLQDCAQSLSKLPALQHKTITIKPQAGLPEGEARAEVVTCLRERLASADAAMAGAISRAQQTAPGADTIAALDQSQRSFSAYRQQACDIAAALPPADVLPEEARLACAIRLAEQRTAEINRLR
jgi:uncharacterized protein YecT (DUF1311 family)